MNTSAQPNLIVDRRLIICIIETIPFFEIFFWGKVIMHRFSLISVGFLSVGLAACGPTEGVIDPGVTAAITVGCGVTKVLLETTDSEKIKKNVGEGSFVDTVCSLFAPKGAASPVQPGQAQMITVTLPDGQTASAVVVRG